MLSYWFYVVMLSEAISLLESALREGAARRPAVEGFPHFAEVLRRNGVRAFTYWLPAMLCVYDTERGPVVSQDTPLHTGMHDVAPFDEAALIRALRADQAGQTTFEEFAAASWRAGVIHFEVNLQDRTCTYVGIDNQSYVEHYPAVLVGAS